MSKAVDPVSVEVYHRVIKGKKDVSQDKAVIIALKNYGKPCTARELHDFMMKSRQTIELISLRRCLTEMSSAAKYGRPWVEKSDKKICDISGQPVNTWKVYNNQLNLFQ